jgi:hypothetical protein
MLVMILTLKVAVAKLFSPRDEESELLKVQARIRYMTCMNGVMLRKN